MGLEQSGASYSPQQGHSGSGRDSFQAVRHSTPTGQLLHSEGLVTSPTPSPRQGKSSLDKNVVNSSAKSATRTGFGQAQNTSAGYLPMTERQMERTSTSPLPVENETVRGQDQLFDDHKSASDPCEHHSDDEELDSLPHTPIEGGDLPVLIEPILKHRPDGQGLATLVDELGSWAIATEKGDKDILPKLPLASPPIQENRDLTQSDDARAGTGGNRSQTDNRGGQGPSQPQRDPVKLLYSHVLAGIFGPSPQNEIPSPHDASLPNSEIPLDEQRGIDDERRQIHSRQRGRRMERPFPSPERTLNPREQLFQGNDDDIDIKGAWFKRAKRGSS